MMAALIRARREQTYEVESLSLMLTSEHWIPVEGVHELPLIQVLVAQQRKRAGNTPREFEADQREAPGCQRCGSSSSIRPAGCVGNRASTSLM